MNAAARWIVAALAAITIGSLGLALDGPNDIETAAAIDADREAAASLAHEMNQAEARIDRYARKVCTRTYGAMSTGHRWTTDNQLVCLTTRPPGVTL